MAYTNSSLVSYTKISPNKTSPRNHVIDTITIHMVVGQLSVETLGDIFAPTSRQASSNYGIGADGRIGMYVEEKDRSWCSSNRDNDHRAITIEVASDKTHPYAVNDKAMNSLINLLADICKRNNIKELKWKADKSLIGQIGKQNMTVHKWFENTSCPGDYLYNKHPYIVEQVNKKLGVATANPAPTPSIPKFTNGDIVNFAGGNHYVSPDATKGYIVKASKAKITATSYGNKHPYHLRAVNDSGVFISGVYGWVDASVVSAITSIVTNTTPNRIDTVKEVQNWANTNYKAGLVVDGIYGAKTKKALVKILQIELNQTYGSKLEVDGIWGTKTKDAIKKNNLRNGSKGNLVKVLQGFLVCNGYSEAYVDGIFGSGTEKSVRKYQEKNRLVVDGICGSGTFDMMCN